MRTPVRNPFRTAPHPYVICCSPGEFQRGDRVPRDIEIVLLEPLGGCLAVPIFVVDPQGDLLFYNESAEPLVGQRFEEAGALSLSEWSDRLRTSDKSGRAMD